MKTIRILPDFSVDNSRMEAVKNAERQSDALHDGPREETVKIELDWISLHFLHLKSVNQPQRHVGDQQESDDLAARFLPVLLGCVNSAAGHVRDEDRLDRHFDDRH